jgi:hypothetical protein
MGVFKSFNGGDEWSSASIGVIDQSARTLVIDPNRNYHTYLGTWHGDSIYKSNDYGSYWFKSNNGISPAKVYSLAIDPANTDMLYAATYFEGSTEAKMPAQAGLEQVFSITLFILWSWIRSTTLFWQG